MGARLRSAYGARLLHLVGLLVAFGLTAYAIVQVAGRPDFGRMAIWFLGAIVLHDLVFLPAYSLLNRLTGLPRPIRDRRARSVALFNHLRGAIALGALLFILFYPSILQKAEGGFLSNADFGTDPFPNRWAWATGVVLVASLVLYVVRIALHRRERPEESGFG